MLGLFILGFGSFWLLNMVVFASAGLLTVWLQKFKIQSWGKFMLSGFILSVLQICLSQVMAGAFGHLSFGMVFLINVIIFLGVAILFKKTAGKISWPERSKANWPVWLILLGPFLLILLLRYFNAVLQVPLEYDNLAYHLPFVAEWYKTGNLWPIYYTAFSGPIGYYPSNFELLALWTVLPFGRDFLVNLLNLPMVIIYGLALYLTARNFSIKPKMAIFITALGLYMPQFFIQLGTPLVDIFFTGLFLISLYFLQEFWRSRASSDLFLGAVASGLFVGTKYLGLPYIFLPLAVCLGGIIYFFWGQKWPLLKNSGLLLLGLFSGGGFWYIRNWRDSGNPLFPAEVKILGYRLFSGYHGLTEKILDYSLSANVNNFFRLKEFAKGFWLMGGSQISLIPPVVFLLVFVISHELIQGKRKQAIVPGLFLVNLIFYFWLYWRAPYGYINLLPNIRYAMVFFVIFYLALGYVAARLRWFATVLSICIPIFCLYNLVFLILNPDLSKYGKDAFILDYQVIFNYFGLFIGFISIIGGELIGLWGNNKFLKQKKSVLSLFLLVFLFGLASHYFFMAVLPHREWSQSYFYEKWYGQRGGNPVNASLLKAAVWFNNNTENASIAYSGFNLHYPFFGRSLEREVDYVNINACTDCRYLDYRDSVGSIRRDPDLAAWLNNLKQAAKNYLVVARGVIPGIEDFEWQWAEQNPQYFQPVFRDGEVSVYKIAYTVQ